MLVLGSNLLAPGTKFPEQTLKFRHHPLFQHLAPDISLFFDTSQEGKEGTHLCLYDLFFSKVRICLGEDLSLDDIYWVGQKVHLGFYVRCYGKDPVSSSFSFFGCTTQHVGSSLPDQGLNSSPLPWKHWTTREVLPVNFLTNPILSIFPSCCFTQKPAGDHDNLKTHLQILPHSAALYHPRPPPP